MILCLVSINIFARLCLGSISLYAFTSCLGSSLVAPCLVLALSHDCLGARLSSMRTSRLLRHVKSIKIL